MEAVQSKLVIVPKEKRHMGVVVRGMADMGCFVCPGLGMKLFEALEGTGLAVEEQGGYFAGFVVGLEAGEEEGVVMKVVDEFLRHLTGENAIDTLGEEAAGLIDGGCHNNWLKAWLKPGWQ